MATVRKVENRGGKRRNQAGRPPKKLTKPLSQDAVERSVEVSERYAERYGKTTDELLHDIAYAVDFAKEATLVTQLKALEKIHERTSPRIAEGGPADMKGSPPVILPARNPDPAKKVH